MIAVPGGMRIVVAARPVDFRNGIDGLAQLCKETLQQDPFSGVVFAFRNRRRTALKVLVYDGQGFWLCQKRLSRGKFSWWPSCSTARAKSLAAHQLQVLFSAGNPDGATAAPDWRPVQPKI